MGSTRDLIIRTGDELILTRGLNAFSFSDIGKQIGIRKASIHYYFPTKTDLAIAIIQKHLARLENRIEGTEAYEPRDKLKSLVRMYNIVDDDGSLCIVGAVITDLNAVEPAIKTELAIFVDRLISWVSQFLEEGRRRNQIYFETSPRIKAMMIITNLMAGLQLARITGINDMEEIQYAILKETKVKS